MDKALKNLTEKEIIELRLKCLEPFVKVASQAGIMQDDVIRKAEVAWQYAIQPLIESQNGITDQSTAAQSDTQ